jgi:hypothetical protein
MGMDVYGNKPKNEKGEYFRNNVWYWHPLWSYCCELAPEITSRVQYGHSNSGDGLNGYYSIQLAKVLQSEVDSGRTKIYMEAVEILKQTAPLEDCYCVSEMVEGLEIIVENDCKICKNTRKRESSLSWYNFTVENVVEFIEFLENCGGFQIC